MILLFSITVDDLGRSNISAASAVDVSLGSRGMYQIAKKIWVWKPEY